jgi:hypothetical protein
MFYSYLNFNIMTKKYLFQVLLSALIFSSCLKMDWTAPVSRTTEISGGVRSYYDAPLTYNGPIHLKIVDDLPMGGLIGGEQVVLLADTLNPPFDFSYELKREDRNSHYYVIIDGDIPQHLAPETNQYFEETRCNVGERNEVIVRVKTHSWVRIHAQNSQPPFNDTLRIPKLRSEQFFEIIANPDTVLLDQGWGSGQVDFDYEVRSETGVQIHAATVHLVAHDTIDYTIIY